ncbi:MAG: hypothetical protein IJP34_00770 [Clostridia bacterium]|nr:hypothetical protein [Clostridia bacterium]
MKYKKILLFSGIALPICLGLRFLQLFYIIETETGFYKPEFKNFGSYILFLIFGFVAATVMFSFFTHRRPDKLPKINIFMSVSSFFLAISIVFELFNQGDLFGTVIWQVLLLRLFGLLSAVWLILFGLKGFLNIKIPVITSAVLGVFWVMKIICNFASISSLALISDNILLIGAYCFVLLFMMNFGKLYSGLDFERGFKKLMATGLGSIILCFTQSVPNIIYNLVTGGDYNHIAMASNVNLFITGIFILVFVLSHFSHKNACERID